MQLKRAQPPLAIQPRDLALLRDLFESRVMTIKQAAAIHFNNRSEMAKKRLQKLKAAALIRERTRHVSEPAILQLTKNGWELLRREGELAEYPSMTTAVFEQRATVSDLTIRHEIGVMDIKAAFVTALLERDELRLARFCTWPQLLEFTVRPSWEPAQVTVKPDGFVQLVETTSSGLFESSFFVEYDRSTEQLDRLVRRAAAYLDYYRSGSFAKWCGATEADYKAYPFRVLVVCQTNSRRENLLRALAQHEPAILTHTWAAVFQEILADPFGKVWRRPKDCVATEGTSEGTEYAQQIARHALLGPLDGGKL